ncbi:MAG TPA: DUF6789 family protein [Anaerolineae bacterium]|nr:DUF6789 family protein [Anaerolineae bacterium]
MSVAYRLLSGVLAGFVATAPMSMFMGVTKRLLPRRERYPLPPHLVTMDIAEKAGVREKMGPRVRAVATAAGHFGYGAAQGGLYGSISRRVPGPAPLKGIVFGLAVWAVSYLGLLPLAGIYRPATEHPAGRNVLMIAAHVVWGAGLGLLFAALSGDGATRDVAG